MKSAISVLIDLIKFNSWIEAISPLIILFVIWFTIVGAIFGGVWTYSINTWLEYLGKPAITFFWTGYILGIVPGMNFVGLPMAVLTLIIHLFI